MIEWARTERVPRGRCWCTSSAPAPTPRPAVEPAARRASAVPSESSALRTRATPGCSRSQVERRTCCARGTDAAGGAGDACQSPVQNSDPPVPLTCVHTARERRGATCQASAGSSTVAAADKGPVDGPAGTKTACWNAKPGAPPGCPFFRYTRARTDMSGRHERQRRRARRGDAPLLSMVVLMGRSSRSGSRSCGSVGERVANRAVRVSCVGERQAQAQRLPACS